MDKKTESTNLLDNPALSSEYDDGVELGVVNKPAEDINLPFTSSGTFDLQAYNQMPSQSWQGFTKEEARQTKLLFVTFLMLLFQFANRIMYKLVTYSMYNYPIYVNIFTCFVYIPIGFSYIIPVAYFYPDIITKEMINYPITKFAWIGFIDAVSNTLQNISVNYVVNAALIILIQQTAIPFSMVISAYMLGQSYTFIQYVGAGLVIGGILISLYPTLVGSAPSNTFLTPQEQGWSEIMWISILAFAQCPICLSSIYKEMALNTVDVDVVLLAGMVGLWQTIFSIIISIPLAPMTGLAIEDLPAYFYDGFNCMCGNNTILEATSDRPADDCANAPIMVGVLIIANTGFQFLITLILRYGTANLLRMASAIMVPTCNIAFSLPVMPHSIPMSPTDISGLIFVMSGLIVYRFLNQFYALMNSIIGFEYFEIIEEEDNEGDDNGEVEMIPRQRSGSTVKEKDIYDRSMLNSPFAIAFKPIRRYQDTLLKRHNSMDSATHDSRVDMRSKDFNFKNLNRKDTM